MLAGSLSLEKLEYIGAVGNAPENEEVLSFHSQLILHHLAALQQLNIYHKSFPWRVLGALDETSWDRILCEMAEQWDFVTMVCDVLSNDHQLFHEMAVTRHQCYRDLMTKAELLTKNWQCTNVCFIYLFRVCASLGRVQVEEKFPEYITALLVESDLFPKNLNQSSQFEALSLRSQDDGD